MGFSKGTNKSGKDGEEMVADLLKKSGLRFRPQEPSSSTRWYNRYGIQYLDFVVDVGNSLYDIISVKRQKIPGTAEEKIAGEIMDLMDAYASEPNKYRHIWVVLIGNGFSSKMKRTLILDKEHWSRRFRFNDREVKLIDVEPIQIFAKRLVNHTILLELPEKEKKDWENGYDVKGSGSDKTVKRVQRHSLFAVYNKQD